VNLFRVDLTEANLRGSVLALSTVSLANVCGTDLTDAHIGWMIFAETDLSRARGLDTVLHDAPSTIGIDAIYQSRGQLPEAFLRGAGVPESFITYVRSLVVNPAELYSCFISYSSKDKEFVRQLHSDLRSNDVRCWYDSEDLKIGDRFRDRIEESIRRHDKLLIVLSANSINSPWVQTEVEAALERERREQRSVLLPISIDDAFKDTPQAWAADLRRTRQIGDFSHWKNHDSYKTALDRLLRDLAAETPPKA